MTKPLTLAENGAGDQRQNDRGPERDAPEFEHAGEQHGQERNHRSRTKIYAADDDDDRRADRDQRNDADLQSQIIEIADREKAISRRQHKKRDHNGGGYRSGERMPQPTRHAACIRSAVVSNRSDLVTSPAAAMRTTRPPRTSATRSDMDNNSWSSELMRMTPLPARVIVLISS